MSYVQIGFLVLFATVFFSAGEFESRSRGRHLGVLWAALSVLVSFLALTQLGSGLLLLLILQVLLFVGIGVFRTVLSSR